MKKYLLSLLFICLFLLEASSQSTSLYQYIFKIDQAQYDWVVKHPKKKLPKSFYSNLIDSTPVYSPYQLSALARGYYFTYRGSYPSNNLNFFQVIDFSIEEFIYKQDTLAFKVFDERKKTYVSNFTAHFNDHILEVNEGLGLIPLKLLKTKYKKLKVNFESVTVEAGFRIEKQKLGTGSNYSRSNDHFMLLDKQNYLLNDTIRFTGFLTDKLKPKKIKKIYADLCQGYLDFSLDKLDLKLDVQNNYSGSFPVKEYYFQYSDIKLFVRYKKGRHWFSNSVIVRLKEYQKENYLFGLSIDGIDSVKPSLKLSSFHQSGRAAPETLVEFYVEAKPQSMYKQSGNNVFKTIVLSDTLQIGINGELNIPIDLSNYPKAYYRLEAYATYYVPGEQAHSKHEYQYLAWEKQNYKLDLTDEGILTIIQLSNKKEEVKLIAHYRDHSDTLLKLSQAFSMEMLKGVLAYELLGPETKLKEQVSFSNSYDYTFEKQGDSIKISWNLLPHDICNICVLCDGKPIFCDDSRVKDTVFKANLKKEWVLKFERKNSQKTIIKYFPLQNEDKAISLQFTAPKEVIPGSKVTIKGNLTGKDGKPLANAQIKVVAINKAVPGFLRYEYLSKREKYKSLDKNYYTTRSFTSAPQFTHWDKVGIEDSSLINRFHLAYPERVYQVLSDQNTRSLEYPDSTLSFGGSFDVVFIKDGLYYKPNYLKLNGHFYSLIGKPWAQMQGHQELKAGLYNLEAGLGKRKLNMSLSIKRGVHQVLILNLDEKFEEDIETSRRRRRFTKRERRSLNKDFILVFGGSGNKTLSGDFLGTTIRFDENNSGKFYGPFNQTSYLNYTLKDHYSLVFPYENAVGINLTAGQIRYFPARFASKRIDRSKYQESLSELTETVYSFDRKKVCFIDFPRFSKEDNFESNSKLFINTDSSFQRFAIQKKQEGGFRYTAYQKISIEAGSYDVFIQVEDTWYWADSFSASDGENILRHIVPVKALKEESEISIPFKRYSASYNFKSSIRGSRIEAYIREGSGNCPLDKAKIKLITQSKVLILESDENGFVQLENPPKGEFIIHIEKGNRNWVSEGKLSIEKEGITELLISLDTSESFYLYNLQKYQATWRVPSFEEPEIDRSYYSLSSFKNKYYYKDFKKNPFSNRGAKRYRARYSTNSRRYRALACPDFGGDDDSYSWQFGDGNANRMDVLFDKIELGNQSLFGYSSNRSDRYQVKSNIGYLSITDGASAGFAYNDFSSFRANAYNSSGRYEVDITSSEFKIRSNFKDQGLWLPSLSSDEMGEFSFDFPVPDDLTTWELHVFAMNNEGDYAHESKSIKSNKSFQVSAVGPNYLRLNDTSCFKLLFNHEDTSEKELVWKLQTGNKEFGRKEKFKTQKSITHCEVANYQDLHLLVRANTEKDQDGVRRVIPVKSKGTEFKTIRWIYLGEGKDTLISASLPNAELKFSQLLGPQELMNQLSKELIEYEFDCNEQLASKYNAYFHKENKSLLERYRMDKIKDQLLKNQNIDGGWSWWDNGPSVAWASGYIYFILEQEDRRYDYSKQQALKRALIYLKNNNSKEHGLWNQAILDDHYTLDELLHSPGKQIKQFAEVFHLYKSNLDYDSIFVIQLLQKEGYLSEGINSRIELLRWNTLLAIMAEKHQTAASEKLLNWFMVQMHGDLSTLEKSFVLTAIHALSKKNSLAHMQGKLMAEPIGKALQFKAYSGPCLLQVKESFFDSTDTYSQGEGVKMQILNSDSILFKQGKTIKLRININLDQPMEYCLFEIPMAAGLLVKESGKHKHPKTDFAVSYRDKYQMAFSHLPAGQSIIELECEAVFAGNYYQAPCILFPMYYPGQTSISAMPARIKILE